MVLLVLAIVWGALLVSWLRSRAESTFSDSVGTFRRHLTVLERAAPTRVAPANRLRGGPPRLGVSPYRPSGGVRVAASVAARTAAAARVAGVRTPTATALRRRQAQKRRRDVFFALLAGVVGSALLAIIPGLSVMWAVQVVFDLCFALYIALLVRLRNLAAERDLKLRFMPHHARPAVRPRPAYQIDGYSDISLRRAAN